jgi:hypothetical protein
MNLYCVAVIGEWPAALREAWALRCRELAGSARSERSSPPTGTDGGAGTGIGGAHGQRDTARRRGVAPRTAEQAVTSASV